MFLRRRVLIFLKQVEGLLRGNIRLFKLHLSNQTTEKDRISVDVVHALDEKQVKQKVISLAKIRFPHRKVKQVTFRDNRLEIEFVPENLGEE